MERQIKFRGKRLKDSKWIYGNLADYSMNVFNTAIEKKVIFSNIVSFATDNFGFVVDDCAVDPETIGQFTGLLDRNGKEIYEGDIIRIDCHAWLDWKELDSVNAEVIFEEYMFDARWRNPDAGQPIPFHPDDDPDYEPEYICEMLANLPNTIEIIGNIHDTPSLISDKQ